MDTNAPGLRSERDNETLAMLEILEKVLSPSNSETANLPLLVSIDLEYDSSSRTIRQVGIAVLDTAELAHSPSESVMSSRLVLLTQHRLPRNHCTRQYLFGIPEDGVNQKLHDLLLIVMMPIDKTSGLHRDVVLIGHNIAADIRAIETACGFNVLSLQTIKAVVDTVRMPTFLFDLPPRQVSLKETCKLVQIKPRQLHNAGNDAMYTMQAALLLFTEFMRNRPAVQDQQSCWIQRLCLLEQVVKNVSYAPKLPKKLRNIDNRSHPPDIMELDIADTGLAALFDGHVI